MHFKFIVGARRLIASSCLVFVAPVPAVATDYTVPPDLFSTLFMNVDDDTLTVNADGTISADDNAVSMTGADQSLENAGTVEAAGDSAAGADTWAILSDVGVADTDTVIVNAAGGSIVATSDAADHGAFGIHNSGTAGGAYTITNSGAIRATGNGDDGYGIGIFNAAEAAAIVNSGGTIEAVISGEAGGSKQEPLEGAHGIYNTGEYATIANTGSGVISGTGTYTGSTNKVSGIFNTGTGTTIVNEATIEAVNVGTGIPDYPQNESYGVYSGSDDPLNYTAEVNDVTIVNSGTISASTVEAQAHGIFIIGDDVTVENSGTITGVQSTPGNDTDQVFDAYGIRAYGEGLTVENDGTITATSTNGTVRGILSQDPGDRVVNNGTITATVDTLALSTGTGGTWDGGVPVVVDIDDVGAGRTLTAWGIWTGQVVNTGSVTATHIGPAGQSAAFANAVGVLVNGQEGVVALDNSGEIVATSQEGGAIGVQHQFYGSFVNSGTIWAAGGLDTYGVLNIAAGDGSMDNSGLVFASAAAGEAWGVLVFDVEEGSSQLDNSGYIVAEAPDYESSGAIHFFTNDATLNLTAGSIIEGEVRFLDYFGEATTGNLITVGPGLDLYLEITGDVSEIAVDTGDRSYFTEFYETDNTLVVVDPGPFAIAPSWYDEVAVAAIGAVEQRFADWRFAGPRGETGADGSRDHADNVWLSGIGGWRERSGTPGDFETWLAGVTGGYDHRFDNDAIVGVFGGYATGNATPGDAYWEQDFETAFGGAYAGLTHEKLFAEIGVIAGHAWSDTSRVIANNTVWVLNDTPDGLETLTGEAGGNFVSPWLTVGADFERGNSVWTPSARARYAFFDLGSYSETGVSDAISTAALDVDGYSAQLFELRGQLSWTRHFRSRSFVTLTGGVDGIFNSGDDITVALQANGEALELPAGYDDFILRGFIGADAMLALSDNAGLTAGAEAGYGTTESLDIRLNAGFTIEF